MLMRIMKVIGQGFIIALTSCSNFGMSGPAPPRSSVTELAGEIKRNGTAFFLTDKHSGHRHHCWDVIAADDLTNDTLGKLADSDHPIDIVIEAMRSPIESLPGYNAASVYYRGDQPIISSSASFEHMGSRIFIVCQSGVQGQSIYEVVKIIDVTSR
jgi:hypothetical protein